jgi:hypothetical protein
MKPEYSNEMFHLIGENAVPAYIAEHAIEEDSSGGFFMPGDLVVETYENKWFARLSAPGYLDCTEWSGPYETLEEAKQYIEETYDVDPDTGEQHPFIEDENTKVLRLAQADPKDFKGLPKFKE